MDVAVELVEAYLRVNGDFTVAEFPLVERGRDGKMRAVTHFDLLACRFPETHVGCARTPSACPWHRVPAGVPPDPS